MRKTIQKQIVSLNRKSKYENNLIISLSGTVPKSSKKLVKID